MMHTKCIYIEVVCTIQISRYLHKHILHLQFRVCRLRTHFLHAPVIGPILSMTVCAARRHIKKGTPTVSALIYHLVRRRSNFLRTRAQRATRKPLRHGSLASKFRNGSAAAIASGLVLGETQSHAHSIRTITIPGRHARARKTHTHADGFFAVVAAESHYSF